MKQLLKQLVPKPLFNLFLYQRELRGLGSQPAFPATFDRLRPLSASMLEEAFDRPDLDDEWEELASQLKRYGLWNAPRTTGCGDLRPLYYLARTFNWRSVLEIGTHVASSTITLAFAMSRGDTESQRRPGIITTVDILDVNDTSRGPWRETGMPAPPIEILQKLQLDSCVDFIQTTGVDYLRRHPGRYDFAFLDGDHVAASVYQEILLSAGQLNQGGIIALHDFAAERMFSSYDNGWIIPGPYLAARRVLGDHDSIQVVEVDQPARRRWGVPSYLALLARRHSDG